MITLREGKDEGESVRREMELEYGLMRERDRCEIRRLEELCAFQEKMGRELELEKERLEMESSWGRSRDRLFETQQSEVR